MVEAAILITIAIIGVFAALIGPMLPSLVKKAFGVDRPRAKIHSVSFTMNSVQAEREGMAITVTASLSNLEGVDCHLVVYFLDSDGNPLRDFNGHFRAANGDVSVGKPLLALRREQMCHGVELFMPYDELHLAPGTHDLSLYIRVCREANNKTLAETGRYNWRFAR